MLIEAQKGLERFTLVGRYCFISDIILALTTQSHSLTYVELIINDFFEDDLSLSSLVKCKNLETLILNDCVSLTTRKMLPLMESALPRIKTIVFARTDAKPEDVIKFIMNNSASVQNVSVMFTKREEIPPLYKMLSTCVQLEKLIISGWRLCADEFLGKIGSLLPSKLKYLNITAEWSFEPVSLRAFLDNCRSPLEYFGLPLCECLKNEHLEVIAGYSKKRATLKRLKIFDAGDKIIRGLKRVGELIDDVELVDPDAHISNTFDD
ncbi:12272_t:CDS:1, partial [Acaulospora colombiana]